MKGYSESSNNQSTNANEQVNKTQLPNPKVQRSDLRVGNNNKLSKKHTIPKENVVMANSRSKRNKYTNDIDNPMNSTNSKIVMDKESYQKIINELGRSELKKLGVVAQEEGNHTVMPEVVKNRPSTNIYGSVKQNKEDLHHYTSFKNKHDTNYNAHPHYIKQKGGANRNILKAKMEIRTSTDSHDNEYNLVLKNERNTLVKAKNGNLIFSPCEDANPKILPISSSKPDTSLSLKSKAWKRGNEVFLSQENISKKFASRNDPYQNALSDKTVMRTASEKRVSNNSKSVTIDQQSHTIIKPLNDLTNDIKLFRHGKCVSVFKNVWKELH